MHFLIRYDTWVPIRYALPFLSIAIMQILWFDITIYWDFIKWIWCCFCCPFLFGTLSFYFLNVSIVCAQFWCFLSILLMLTVKIKKQKSIKKNKKQRFLHLKKNQEQRISIYIFVPPLGLWHQSNIMFSNNKLYASLCGRDWDHSFMCEATGLT